MELHQLKYVIAVAETGSFSRAAERLFVVQSNVSAQVRKLEREVGAPLFERRPHQVVLTEFGRVFLPRARDALGALEDAQAAVNAVRGLTLGSAELGILGTVCGWLLPPLVERFRTEHPLIDLWLTEEPTVSLADLVASRRLAQALVNVPVNNEGLNTEVLFREELVVVVPPDHPKRGEVTAPLAAFAQDEWLLPEPGNALRSLIWDALATVGTIPTPKIQVGRKELMHELAIAGCGTALLPARTALHRLGTDSRRIIRVAGHSVIRSVGLITHQADRRSPGDRALADVLRDVVAQHTSEPGTHAASRPSHATEDERAPVLPITIE